MAGCSLTTRRLVCTRGVARKRTIGGASDVPLAGTRRGAGGGAEAGWPSMVLRALDNGLP